MAEPTRAASVPQPASPLILGLPRPAFVLATALLAVGLGASAYLVAVPFDTAAFGGLTVPVVLASGVADGFNPCAFALLVLFATYTLTMVNAVTSDGSPTLEARRRLLGAGSLYVGAVWVTYFIIGLGLLSFLAACATISSPGAARFSPSSWAYGCSRTSSFPAGARGPRPWGMMAQLQTR